jgi:hypothetical protein
MSLRRLIPTAANSARSFDCAKLVRRRLSLLRSGWRICALSRRLCRRVRCGLLTGGAGPHDEAYDDQRRDNGRANDAGVPIVVIAIATDISISGRQRTNVGRLLRARVGRVLLRHWHLPFAASQRAVPCPCSWNRMPARAPRGARLIAELIRARTKQRRKKPLDVLQKGYISHIVNYSAGDTLFAASMAGVSGINTTNGELGDRIDEYRDE